METLQKEFEVEIRWRSFELRPKGTPIPEHYRQRILNEGRPRMKAMAREHYGIEINDGPFGIDSRPALILDKYAEAQGKGAQFHDEVFRAYWQEAKSIEDESVLKEIMTRVGLDSTHYEAAIQNPDHAAAVDADIAQAYAYGLNGVPALIFNNKYLVSGAQPYEVLKQVVEKVSSEQ
ncbi:MAG: DsbA family protein [Chloroflexi bacterium]|nr:DsbA family protein [Chloroflexota bacterium]